VENSGRLEGQVTTRALVIQEGAVVQSQIHMLFGHDSTHVIPKERVPYQVSLASPSGKAVSHRLKPGHSGSADSRPVESQPENREELA
jgi:hypothetical protein